MTRSSRRTAVALLWVAVLMGTSACTSDSSSSSEQESAEPVAATARRVPPQDTAAWVGPLRDADKAAPARPALEEYEQAMSNLTGMCREDGPTLAVLVERLGASANPVFDDPAGRRYTAIGWLASMQSRPGSDCTTVAGNWLRT